MPVMLPGTENWHHKASTGGCPCRTDPEMRKSVDVATGEDSQDTGSARSGLWGCWCYRGKAMLPHGFCRVAACLCKHMGGAGQSSSGPHLHDTR